MSKKEEIKYLIDYYQSSLNKLDFYDATNNNEYFSLFQKIDDFIEENRSGKNLDKLTKDFLDFLSILSEKIPPKVWMIFKSECPNIEDVLEYQKKLKKVLEILSKPVIEKKDLKYFDELFQNPNIIDFFNLDEKKLRFIEDKIYRRLTDNKQAEEWIKQCFENNIKINPVLGVYLAIQFYRSTKHPAQIVTFYKDEDFPGYFNKEDGNINIDFNHFQSQILKKIEEIKENKEKTEYYNIELLLLIFHECIHFNMLYKNKNKEENYEYECNLCKMAQHYKMSALHDKFYLEYCAETRAYDMLIALLKTTLKNSESEYFIKKLTKAKEKIETEYFGIIEGVRTRNPHEEIYKEMEHLIEEDQNTERLQKDKSITALRFNKYSQERENSVFDEYLFTEEEIKKILLVVLLEYTKSKTYSNFNRDLIKDIIIMDINAVIEKYKKKEYKNSLQKLYLELSKSVIYTQEIVVSSIMALPMDYPYLDKINYLNSTEALVRS